MIGVDSGVGRPKVMVGTGGSDEETYEMLLRREGGGADAGGVCISDMFKEGRRSGGAGADGEEPKTNEWRRRAAGESSTLGSGEDISNVEEGVKASDLSPRRALGDGEGEGVGRSPLVACIAVAATRERGLRLRLAGR